MIIIFPTKAIADEMLLDLAATPNDGVWVYYNPEKTYETWDEEAEEMVTKHYPNVISYNQADDGRCAIAHPFSQSEIEWLQEWWDDDGALLNGVLFVDKLPEGWSETHEV